MIKLTLKLTWKLKKFSILIGENLKRTRKSFNSHTFTIACVTSLFLSGLLFIFLFHLLFLLSLTLIIDKIFCLSFILLLLYTNIKRLVYTFYYKYKDIAQNGNASVKDFRKHEKLKYKQNKLKLDIFFLNNCKELGVYSKFWMFQIKMLYHTLKSPLQHHW